MIKDKRKRDPIIKNIIDNGKQIFHHEITTIENNIGNGTVKRSFEAISNHNNDNNDSKDKIAIANIFFIF